MRLDELTTRLNNAESGSEKVAAVNDIIEESLHPNFFTDLEMTASMVQTHKDTEVRSTPDMHNHNFYEFLCVIRGEIDYLIGDRRYHIGPGDIIFLPPGAPHCPIYPEVADGTYERYVIWASNQFMASLRNLFPESSSTLSDAFVLRTAGSSWEHLTALFAWGVQEAEAKAPGWELMVSSSTCQIIAYLSRAWQEISDRTPVSDAVDLQDQVLQYIQLHLAEKITLASTARHFLVCESTISQLFRKKMGQSFYRCVTQRRLVEAKNLIFQGVPLDQVGVQVGFQDYSSFYRAFKAEFGLSPSQYRKMLQT